MKDVTVVSKTIPANPRSDNYQAGSTIVRTAGGTTVITPGGGDSVDILKENDNRSLTDTMVMSALRSVAEFISKKNDSSVKAVVDYLNGIKIGGTSLTKIIQKSTQVDAYSDSDVMSALRVIDEILNNNEKLKELFLSRQNDDEASGLIKFLQGIISLGDIVAKSGITVGTFIAGLLGSGARIDEDGFAEMTGLTLREFLEVPELRFNRIDVVSGELWNSISFGTVESVDTVNRIARIKLVDGELQGSHVNDFCRGLFHNLAGGNAVQSGKDENGFDTLPGFSTSYFTPVELLSDGKSFRYELKPGTRVHPCKAMKFAVYGNATDKSRQASAYSTRTYKRYLKDVNTWEISEKNIAMQFGDCSGLVINGKDMSGYSAYLNNIYITGVIEWLEEHKDEFKGRDGYSVSLSSYDAVVAVNSDGQIDSSLYDIINIVSGEEKAYSGDYPVTTTKYKIQTQIQAMYGSVVLLPGETVGTGKYLVSITAKGCEYHYSGGIVIITKITEDKATLEITINCEGMAVFNKTFTLTRVYGERGFTGADGKDIEFIYHRSSKDTAVTPVSEDRDGYVPEGWTDNPTGVNEEFSYEFISRRIKDNGTWGVFSTPSVWSRFSKDGKDGDSVTARYSPDKTNWHEGFLDGDIYMQLYVNGVESGGISRIVGETGAEGKYTDFQFSKSNSATIAPNDGWQDAPPAVSATEYLWMRSGLVIPPQTNPDTWTAVRIGGTKGDSIDAEYSTNGTGWHTYFMEGDIYMRQRIGNGEWTSSYRIVGEAGTDGKYTDYQFAVNESLTDSPVEGWQDAPPAVSPGQYLWMRSGVVIPPQTNPDTWTAVRIGGTKGDDGNDGPGFEIVFKRSKTNTSPSTPESKQQDSYVPEGWTDDQTGTSAVWPYEFSCRRRKVNGVWSRFSSPALWAKYGFDGDDAYSVALSSYESVITLNSKGEIDSSLYDILNIVGGNELVYTGSSEVVTKRFKVQTKIYAWHGATALVYADTAGTGTYSVTITATGCEYTIVNGVITITKVTQDRAALDIVINCEGKITFEKAFTLTRVWNGQDANLLPWINDWNNNKTLIDGEYVVSPKIFSGTRSVNGKLTGIAQGKECITIDGVKRTGIFALVDDEVVFELDPVNKKYVFRGVTYSPVKEVVISNPGIIDISDFQNYLVRFDEQKIAIIYLPKDTVYNGAHIKITAIGPPTEIAATLVIFSSKENEHGKPDNQFIYDGMDATTVVRGIAIANGTTVLLTAIKRNNMVDWIVENYNGVTINYMHSATDCWPNYPKENGWYTRLNKE